MMAPKAVRDTKLTDEAKKLKKEAQDIQYDQTLSDDVADEKLKILREKIRAEGVPEFMIPVLRKDLA